MYIRVIISLLFIFSLTYADEKKSDEEFCVKGEYFDIFCQNKKTAEEYSKKAEELGARFKEIYGTKPLRGAILITTKNFKKSTSDIKYSKNGAKYIWRWIVEDIDKSKPGDYFVHEFGHIIFIFHIDPNSEGGPHKEGNYGSSLPDWLDESSAIIMQSQDWKNSLLKDVCKNIQNKETIPLKELVTMTNPVHKDFEAIREGKEIDRTKSDEKHKFYCQSYALFEYIHSKFGTDFVSKLITALKEKKSFESFLKSYAEKNKECPATIDELEEKWKEWIVKTQVSTDK